VLGCTHFPLLAQELAAAAPHPVTWMDSGAAIARRVATILGIAAPVERVDRPAHKAIFTADTPNVARMRSGLGTFGLDEVGFLKV
jgi:glutamate racemase